MNREDTTTYLEIQADGSISVETMPAWETDGFATKILIGAGVVLVTAVVATIAIMVPGANCVVVSVCVGAAKGAAIGAASGFAMGFVEPLVGITIEGVATGNWDFSNYFNDALSAAADGFASGAITGAIMGDISGGLNPKYCFAAGTPIATANGAIAIENIEVGDTVWSYDYKTGEKSLKLVTATTVRETNRVITLEINGEKIVTTPEHPFYVINNDKYNGYVAAKYLSAGDCILTADGGYLPITSIEPETLDELITVYNFTVEDNHSYYVGDNEFLVHNANCNTIKANNSLNPEAPSQVTGYKKHGINQAISRDSHGVSVQGILNTIKNPSAITKKVDSGQISYVFKGKGANVVLNEAGEIVTAFAKASTYWRF
jgi:hypothetical protein